MAFAVVASAVLAMGNETPARRYQTRRIEGWTVRVEERLLADDTKGTERALELLRGQLTEIIRLVPAKALQHIRSVTLWFSPEYPGIQPTAEYHPDAGWLRANQRNPDMARGVEFTNVWIFEAESVRMPMLALHELAHAYQDQVLTAEQPEILAAWQKAKAGGRYDAVRRHDGRVERAYALTNDKEYFAEATEAFFGRNDWYPFTRAELREQDPEMEVLLIRLWGVKETKP